MSKISTVTFSDAWSVDVGDVLEVHSPGRDWDAVKVLSVSGNTLTVEPYPRWRWLLSQLARRAKSLFHRFF